LTSIYRRRKKTVIGAVILSLFIDGFCLGYLFSFFNSRPKRTPQSLVASAEPPKGIDTSSETKTDEAPPTENTIHSAPEIDPLYYKGRQPIEPLHYKEPQTVESEDVITPMAVPPEHPSTPAPVPAPIPGPVPSQAPAQVTNAPLTKREEEIAAHGHPAPFVGPKKDYEKELEALEKANQLHSPTEAISLQENTMEKNLSPFIAWPKFQFEAGPGSGRDSFQSVIGPFTLNNSNLVRGMGYFLRGQASISPRLVTEAKYVSNFGNIANPGTTVIDQGFQTDETTVGLRYRIIADHTNGLGYYVGLGMVHTDDYRYTYLNNLTGLIVNRPETFDDVKVSLGAEMNSYYLFRGRFEFNYYKNVANTSQGGAGSGYAFTLLDGQHFSLDTSISHIVTGDMYLGLGVQYLFHAYSFTSNELGPTYQGSVTKTRVDAFLFLGIEL